ncbi:hypothetical protein [Brevibacterium sediminis]
MSRRFNPDSAIFKNASRTTGYEDPEQAFVRRKKKSLKFLLAGVIFGAIFIIAVIGYQATADPYAEPYEISAAQSFWSAICGISFTVAAITLFAALVVRIWAGIKR